MSPLEIHVGEWSRMTRTLLGGRAVPCPQPYIAVGSGMCCSAIARGCELHRWAVHPKLSCGVVTCGDRPGMLRCN